MTLLIFYLLLALSISFLCSVLEAVLLSTPVSFVSMKEKEGSKSALLFKKLKQDIDKPLSAILSLNTVAHTIGAAGVGSQAVEIFGEAYFGIISAILTILILVLSEIIPKTVGASYWRALAMVSAKIINVMVIICYPLVWLSELITKLIAPKNRDLSVSREEVSAMLTIGVEEGTFQNKENKIMQNLIRLESIKAKEIMTPRVVVSIASESMTMQEFYEDKTFLQYSRIPIYAENRDNIMGYVLRKSVLEQMAEDNFKGELSAIKRNIRVFLESTPITTIWEDMLSNKEHIALVIDEYGSFEGIVTMEDIIETIFGLEILDEKDSIVDMQQYARERWTQRKEKYKHIITRKDA